MRQISAWGFPQFSTGRSNGTNIVIDTLCTFLLSSPVYTESHPRRFPISRPTANHIAQLPFPKSFTCHSYKLSLQQVLSLPLIRKHRGCMATLPILKLVSRSKQSASLERAVPKIAPVTPLKSALIEVLIPENLKLFGMNTYKKYREEGVLLLTRHPMKDVCPERPTGAEGSLRGAQPVPAVLLHRSPNAGHAPAHSRSALLSLRIDLRGIGTNHV